MRERSAHFVKMGDVDLSTSENMQPRISRYEIRHQFNRLESITRCENALEYVLIGKDETQKNRWYLFPSENDLFQVIDAMPMRRFEMRQRGEN